jgi:hypothetical protein
VFHERVTKIAHWPDAGSLPLTVTVPERGSGAALGDGDALADAEGTALGLVDGAPLSLTGGVGDGEVAT